MVDISWKRLLVTLLCVAGAMNPAMAQEPPHLALITDLNGAVVVTRAANGVEQQAVWGTQLFQGDRVETREAAAVSVLFSNNNLITLGANSSVTISAGPGQAPPAAESTPVKTVGPGLLADVSDLTLRREGGNLAALGGLRAGDDAAQIDLLAPRNTVVKTRQPTFVWHADSDVDRAVVKVFDENGLVWSKEATEGRLDYPADVAPLKAGTAYFWQVETEDLLDTVTSPSVSFRVLTEEALQDVTAQEAAIRRMFEDDLNSSNYHYVLGAYYAKHGLLDAAIDAFSQIVVQHPDAALPQQILGKLYQDVGLKDQAIAALQRSIELSQKN